MSGVFVASRATICARLIRQNVAPSSSSSPLPRRSGGDRTLNKCGKHLHLGKRLQADLPRDEHDPLVFPGAPPVDRVGGSGGSLKREVASSPRLLTLIPVSVPDWKKKRVEAEMLVAVMCVGRNAPVLSLRQSYARRFGGNLCLVQCVGP